MTLTADAKTNSDFEFFSSNPVNKEHNNGIRSPAIHSKYK